LKEYDLLDREIYLAFWIVIFALMGFYLLGKLKFAHDSEIKSVSVPRLMLAILTFSFVVYLIPGMFGAPLKALAGYLPPSSTQDFDINAIVRNNYETSRGNSNDQLCESPKYADILELPHGLKGYFDYEQGLKCSKATHKPIFIDFTGHGCVNCREMEARVWSDPRVLNILKNDYIVVALYVDDKTALPENDWVTSKFDGQIKKTIGQKYADFQITKFNVNAQPYYVLMNDKGEELVEAKAYDKNVDNFIAFLNAGKKAFKNNDK
jgi:thiol:disulfide interchange protein DsbD